MVSGARPSGAGVLDDRRRPAVDEPHCAIFFKRLADPLNHQVFFAAFALSRHFFTDPERFFA
jgi:hypothetical protein